MVSTLKKNVSKTTHFSDNNEIQIDSAVVIAVHEAVHTKFGLLYTLV